MLGRWRKSCDRYGWRHLPVDIQRHCREVPNWVRGALGIQNLKGPHAETQLPEEVVEALDKVFVAEVHSTGPGRKGKSMLKNEKMVETMKNTINRYNARVDVANSDVKDKLMELHTRWKQGLIPQDEFVEAFSALRPKSKARPGPMWSRKYSKIWGWSDRSIRTISSTANSK